MSKNEFDDWLVNKVEEGELDYRPEHWQQLAQKLTPSPKRRIVYTKWRTVAAGVAAALLIAAGWALLDKPVVDPSPKLGHQPNAMPANTPSTTNQAESEPSTTEQNEVTVAKQQNTKSTTPPPTPSNVMPNWVATTNSQQTVIEPIAEPGTVITPEQAPEPIVKESFIPSKQQPEPNSIAIFPNATPEPLIPTSNKKRTTLSVGGGVNYGSVNTGYAVAVSARRDLGNNFFIDGTVAMMYNGNTSQITNYNQGAVQSASRPLAANSMISTPAISPTNNNLYYVQFNPTFGYKVDENISLSVGGDVQQMLDGPDPGELKISTADQKVRVFPTMDVGITAKSEFDIAPNIQAGMLYREGLNNYFSNTTEYFNRRYIQVQFKYNIPLK